jgi:hypothetical protein
VTTLRLPSVSTGPSTVESDLSRRPPAGDKRKAYIVRPKRGGREAAWEAAVARRGLTVGVWLLALADEASGWREP